LKSFTAGASNYLLNFVSDFDIHAHQFRCANFLQSTLNGDEASAIFSASHPFSYSNPSIRTSLHPSTTSHSMAKKRLAFTITSSRNIAPGRK
ncbi:hypothetical protein PMAYCL1PPCAC_04412, partial [Pristionchus mayeri]